MIRRVVFSVGALVALLGTACGTQESFGTSGSPISTPSTTTPTATSTSTATLVTDRQSPATATPEEKATATAIDTIAGAISLPEGLEFLGSGQANRDIPDAESAVAAAYLSDDDSRDLYAFFLESIENDGWTIVESRDASQSSPEGEISAHNGENSLLVEVWDLDKTNVTESIDMLSALWSIYLSPERLAQGQTLVFTALLPCSPDLPVDCE